MVSSFYLKNSTCESLICGGEVVQIYNHLTVKVKMIKLLLCQKLWSNIFFSPSSAPACSSYSMESFTVWFILTSFIISLVLEPPVAHCGGWDCAWKRPSILITMTHYITLHGPLYNSPWPSILLTMAHYIAHHGRSYQSSWPDILLTMARPTYFSLWSSISLNIIQDIAHHDPTYCSLWLSTMLTMA